MARTSDERGTPKYIIDAARAVMGGIDLDPAGCAAANKVVRADCFYTKEDNGLNCAWFGNVWLNPPFSRPLCEQFIDKLLREYDRDMEQAIILTNTSTGTWYHKLLERFPVVFPRHHELHPNARIEFYPLPGNDRGTNNNSGGQAIWYVPPKYQFDYWLRRFLDTFGEFCTVPWAVKEWLGD